MKPISKLNSISVVYNDEPTHPKEFNSGLRTRKEFTDSLKTDPLSSISYLYFSYGLNLRIVATSEPNKWLVKKDDDDFFSFTCHDDKKFIETFEQKLIEKFIRHHNYDPNPPAKMNI